MTEAQQECLVDIFSNMNAPEKVIIKLDPSGHNVTIIYPDMDEQWFAELQEAAKG